jgi:trans-aconitate methyltransferase
MSKSIVDIASDPLQYDLDELIWTDEGNKSNPNRKLYLIALKPLLKTVLGLNVLDVGCGQGWLCDEIVKNGGIALGIEPSSKIVQIARIDYPDIRVIRSSLQDFHTDQRFSVITAVMVLEHFKDLENALNKINTLLELNGRFITIVGDFDKFTDEKGHHPMEKQTLRNDEVATRVNFGDRAGIMCDIIRTVDRYIELAYKANLKLNAHTPIMPEPWHPRYTTHKGSPIFHLIEFIKA